MWVGVRPLHNSTTTSCWCAYWWAATMAQVTGFLPHIWETWSEFTIPNYLNCRRTKENLHLTLILSCVLILILRINELHVIFMSHLVLITFTQSCNISSFWHFNHICRFRESEFYRMKWAQAIWKTEKAKGISLNPLRIERRALLPV